MRFLGAEAQSLCTCYVLLSIVYFTWHCLLYRSKYLVFTWGQVDYTHLHDNAEVAFRQLLHVFTPKGG